MGGSWDLWECPECGLWFVHTQFIGFDEQLYGTPRESLDRLTREQSDVIHATISCQADPAAIEAALFALPVTAFALALRAAYAKDRDFVALFIPSLVHAFAAHPHAVVDTLHALVDETPSYAREVLAATSSLPPELRKDLVLQLEDRCKQNPSD